MAIFACLLLLGGESTARDKWMLLRIHRENWEIVFVKSVSAGPEEYTGYTYCKRKRIEILSAYCKFCKVQPDQAVTVLHELQHAFVCDTEKDTVNNKAYNNLGDMSDHDHDGIGFAAAEWAAFIQDNPHVIAWIQRQKRPEL